MVFNVYLDLGQEGSLRGRSTGLKLLVLLDVLAKTLQCLGHDINIVTVSLLGWLWYNWFLHRNKLLLQRRRWRSR